MSVPVTVAQQSGVGASLYTVSSPYTVWNAVLEGTGANACLNTCILYIWDHTAAWQQRQAASGWFLWRLISCFVCRHHAALSCTSTIAAPPLLYTPWRSSSFSSAAQASDAKVTHTGAAGGRAWLLSDRTVSGTESSNADLGPACAAVAVRWHSAGGWMWTGFQSSWGRSEPASECGSLSEAFLITRHCCGIFSWIRSKEVNEQSI